MKRLTVLLLIISLSLGLCAQQSIEGYVFESGNRGYISDASISVYSSDKSILFSQTTSNDQGIYTVSIPDKGTYIIEVIKSPFIEHQEVVDISSDALQYLKHEVNRIPGYIFEVTLAEKNEDDNVPKGGLKGALIEVYNNTKRAEVLRIDDLQDPNFQLNLLKGNHYTILVRKEGFLAKRMEVFVNVKDCILCFEGVGEVAPGVTDNLTESNSMGVLLANVELERYDNGQTLNLENLHFQSSSSKITESMKSALDDLALFYKDNERLLLEIGAHTDSKGKSNYNLKLSQDRARAVAEYLANNHDIPTQRLFTSGYGETHPLNKCKNGINCSETEHAKNRRTEIKILNLDTNLPFRSLSQKKTEELMEDILSDLADQGQIKVEEGQDINDIIAKKEEELIVNENISIPESKSESPSSHDVVDSPIRDENESEVEAIDVYIDGSLINQSPENLRTSAEPTVLKNDSDRYGPEYTGYKIVLMFSRYELNSNHPLVQHFKKLDIYTTADSNYLYMIGSYPNRRSAQDTLEKRYLSSYPTAYVVGFERGIITD